MSSRTKDLEAILDKLDQIHEKMGDWILTKSWTTFCVICGLAAVALAIFQAVVL